MWFIAVTASIVLLVLIYLACQQGSLNIRRSLEIDATVDAAFAGVLDLKTWPQWSPWLMHDPDTRLEYGDELNSEGGYCSWDGKIVGSGKITHVEIRQGRSIRQQIEFQRPFKAVHQIDWTFEKRDEGVLVSWEMSGKMPFLFRFKTRRMEAMIERDYDLGLALLAGYLNNNSAHPAFTFVGSEELQNFKYWAIPCNGNLRQLEAARLSSIETLRSSAAARIGLSLTLYHEFDPLGTQFQSEIAVPIGDNAPLSNYQQRSFPGGQYFKMTLHGDLRFLPLAWYALATHCRLHKIKIESTRSALEIYHQDPGDTTESCQTVTTLYLPIEK